MTSIGRLWEEFGQSVWLDFIQRSLLTSGGLERLIKDDGVRGVTSNPSIFEKALARGEEYGQAINALLSEQPSMSTTALYEALAIEDIRKAADQLDSVWIASDGIDGYVSLEVSPHLAEDTAGTVAEARRLWQAVDRRNLMIKVPATAAGTPAIAALIGDGINVNATLLFSIADYEAVAKAYLDGLRSCPEPSQVASVASFFVSRMDTVVDAQLEAVGSPAALALRGSAAVANARCAYHRFQELCASAAFAALKRRGARAQRPLWASTSTKNPAYSDVLYVEELIAPDTVNTIPLETLEAFRDHGQPRASIAAARGEPEQKVAALAELGIDLDQVARSLQIDGVAAFAASFDKLLSTLEGTRSAFTGA